MLITPPIPKKNQLDDLSLMLRKIDAGSTATDTVVREGFILSHLNFNHDIRRFVKFEEYPIFHTDDIMIRMDTEYLAKGECNDAQRRHAEKQLAKYTQAKNINTAQFYHKEAWRTVYERDSRWDSDEQKQERTFEKYEPYLSSYGIVDYPEQLLELYDLEADPRRFFVRFTEMRKENQYPEGGWRWHKWGEYLGKQDPQCEYLYDEPVITSVWVFHIYQLEDSVPGNPSLI